MKQVNSATQETTAPPQVRSHRPYRVRKDCDPSFLPDMQEAIIAFIEGDEGARAPTFTEFLEVFPKEKQPAKAEMLRPAFLIALLSQPAQEAERQAYDADRIPYLRGVRLPLTECQHNVLLLLCLIAEAASEDIKNMAQAAEALGMSRQGFHHHLRPLTKKGYIEDSRVVFDAEKGILSDSFLVER